MTISQAIREGAETLLTNGVDAPQQTASLLLSHILCLDRARVIAQSNEQLSASHYRSYRALIERRAVGEPLQYITGHQEFFGLDFAVSPAVLIPRPETEVLVERVIKLVSQPSMPPQPLIVELGTGSGCIAVAVAKNVETARIVATELSGEALKLARANATRHSTENRIEFREGDLFEPLLSLKGLIDIVCCNPPYVPEDMIKSLQREVRDWEPLMALRGGTDGVDFYRRLLAESPVFLRPGGYLVCEFGYSQVEAITHMLDPTTWTLTNLDKDLQGIPRTLAVRLNRGFD